MYFDITSWTPRNWSSFLNKHRATRRSCRGLQANSTRFVVLYTAGEVFLDVCLTLWSLCLKSCLILFTAISHGGASFLKVFNGTRLFLHQHLTMDVMTDACSLAAGGYFQGDWFYFSFAPDSPAWAHLHMNHKETLAITKHWAPCGLIIESSYLATSKLQYNS